MRKLILIKHAKPAVDEQIPSHEWGLSQEGRYACAPLAEALRAHDPAVIASSDEPKALETARLVGEALGKPVEELPDLREHDRSNVPMMRSRDFISTMALFFKDRTRLVCGRETAQQATARISRAVDQLLAAHPTGNVAAVTHGTVLALFASEHGAGDAFGLWRRLGLPSIVVFSCPDLRVLEIVDRI